ncbi:hypothetical protein P692DRAFT_20748284, partial [Suillus brevipes Sb2]
DLPAAAVSSSLAVEGMGKMICLVDILIPIYSLLLPSDISHLNFFVHTHTHTLTRSLNPSFAMSTAQNANQALFLVAEKVGCLLMRAQKLKEGDPASKALAHDIAVTISTSFGLFGAAVTSLLPMLLSCAAEIRNNCGPNGKMRGVSDWSTRLRSPTPAPAPAPAPATPPAPSLQLPAATAISARPLTPIPSSLSPPPHLPAAKHNLFVAGTTTRSKRKAPPTKDDDDDEVQVTEPVKTAPACKLPAKATQKKIKFAVVDEEPPNDDVIYVKTKPAAGPSSLLANAPVAASTVTKDNNSDADMTSIRLHSRPCKKCIKDDLPSTVFFSEKVEEVCTSCTRCHEKKMKCVHPSPQQEEALHAAVTLKKSKAAAKKTQATSKRKPSAGQLKSRSTPGPGKRETRSVSRRRPTPITPEIIEDDEQDTEGEADPEITAASDADMAADQTPEASIEGGAEVGVEGEGGTAETPLDFDAGGGPIVDNNVNMDPPVLDQRPSPVAARDDIPTVLPAQPTPLQILQSIEALGTKFDSLLRQSADCVEAVETKVDTLETAWVVKFALMETKMQEMSTTTMKNTISLGHIANKLNTFTRTGNVTAFNPPADISVGSPYGQLPTSWFLRVTNASNVGGSSISSMGRALTTAWDESQALVQTAPGTSSISAIPVTDEASSEKPCEPSGSVSTAME